jgi:hypothetical protein|tara:strand:+ start:266 stop:457 length:192 start_codon:yes stop_codon:yes gene_type:complete
MSKYYFVDEPNKLYTLKQICKIFDSLAETEDKNNKGYKWIDFVNPIDEAQISFDVSIGKEESK